jgi:hypothetical protein
MEMETWKHGDINIETCKHGEMETWREGDMETWRYQRENGSTGDFP